MKKRVRVALLAAAVALAVYGAVSWFGGRGGEPLVLSGVIETTEAQLGFKIAGRLAARLVDEGQAVEAGAVVARLDKADQEAGLAKARASLAYSEAALAELENGYRAQDVAQARADVEQARAARRTAQAQLAQAAADETRYQELYAKGVVSTQERDAVHTRFRTATAALDEAEARLRSAMQRASLLEEGPRREQIDQARAKAAVDREAVRQAELQLEYVELRAPFAGVVLSKSVEPGEYLNAGQAVVTLGDLKNVWLRCYAAETELGRVRLGQSVELTADSFPGRTFRGAVSFIAGEAEFTPKTVQTFKERVKLMYRIKVDLPNPDLALKPGMPADAHLAEESR